MAGRAIALSVVWGMPPPKTISDWRILKKYEGVTKDS